MTPTRLQLIEDLHNLSAAPSSFWDLTGKGRYPVEMRYAEYEGLPGFLVQNERGAAWIPLVNVRAIEVDPRSLESSVLSIEPDAAPISVGHFEVGGVELASLDGHQIFHCGPCAKTFKNATALASHRRSKHPEGA